MKQLIFLLILALLLFLFKPEFILAQEKTDVTNSAQVDKKEVLNSIKKRIEDGVARAKTATESSKPRWYGYFGTVTEIGEKTITVKTSLNENKKILFEDPIELSLFKTGRGKTTINPDAITKGWFAIAMGNSITNNQSLLAKRITFTESAEEPIKRQVISGKIVEIDESTIKIINGKNYSITIPDDYTLKIKGVSKPKIENVTIEDKAVAVITVEQLDKDPIYTLKSIYVLPKTDKTATAEDLRKVASSSAKTKEATAAANTKNP